jgi:fructoselysine-6-P-deglycase FrlB-like protein
MAEMVASQPVLVASILGLPAAREIARLAEDALAAGDPIVVVGCGTSEHGAQAVAELMDAGLRLGGRRPGLVEARQALEATLDPRPGGVCLAVSHDGGTRATLLAAEAARAAGARVALVTARSEGPIAAIADALLVTPAVDRSWCHTVAYASAILAGAAIGSALASLPLDPTPVAAYLQAALAGRAEMHSFAERLAAARPIVACGSGSDRVTAREFSLKIEEGPRIPAVARDLETLLHGHLVACDGRTGLVLLAIDDRGGERRDLRLRTAAEASSAVGIAPVALLSPASAGVIPSDAMPGGRFVLPPPPASPLPPLVPLLGGMAALQLLTLALVDVVGVNPDLIRREEAPWRTAAAIAEDAGDW